MRLIGEDSPQGTLKGLLKWVPQMITWIDQGREPYLFVHQPENLESPGLARTVHAALRMQCPKVAELPDAPDVEEPEQSSMF